MTSEHPGKLVESKLNQKSEKVDPNSGADQTHYEVLGN